MLKAHLEGKTYFYILVQIYFSQNEMVRILFLHK